MTRPAIRTAEELQQKLEEHSLYRTYCARCGGHFLSNHPLEMVLKEYTIHID